MMILCLSSAPPRPISLSPFLAYRCQILWGMLVGRHLRFRTCLIAEVSLCCEGWGRAPRAHLQGRDSVPVTQRAVDLLNQCRDNVGPLHRGLTRRLRRLHRDFDLASVDLQVAPLSTKRSRLCRGARLAHFGVASVVLLMHWCFDRAQRATMCGPSGHSGHQPSLTGQPLPALAESTSP